MEPLTTCFKNINRALLFITMLIALILSVTLTGKKLATLNRLATDDTPVLCTDNTAVKSSWGTSSLSLT